MAFRLFATGPVYSSDGSPCVASRNIPAAQKWYAEKFGFKYAAPHGDGDEACTVLGYSKDNIVISLADASANPNLESVPERPPIIFANKLDRAHESLMSKGVQVDPVEADSGGNRFFRFRDLDGNKIEICEDH